MPDLLFEAEDELLLLWSAVEKDKHAVLVSPWWGGQPGLAGA